jgi:hypothetical protein
MDGKKGIGRMENTSENKESTPSWMDFWTKSLEFAWGPGIGMQTRSAFWPMLSVPVWNGNGNGTVKRMQEMCRSSMKIWQSMCFGMINPEGVESFPQAMKDLQECFLKVQQRELDNIVQLQSEWFDKMDALKDLSQKMYIRTVR